MTRRAVLAAVVATSLTGCALAPPAPPACPSGLGSADTVELLFGRNIAGVPGVSDEDWNAFVESEVTSRFPLGFTIFDADGQWRGGSGQVERERSKVILVVLSSGRDEMAKVDAVRAAYKARFNQEGVLLIRRTACVSF